MFADTQDHIKIANHCIRTNKFTNLKNDLNKQEKDKDSRIKEMKKWYNTSTNSNFDRILSVFTQNECIVSQVAVPLHNNGHFIMLEINLPSPERTSNKVTNYDYFRTGNNDTNLRANMW